MNSIFESVLYVGPEKEYGGMGSVLEIYSQQIKDFKFIPTYPSPSTVNRGIKFKIRRLTFFIQHIVLYIKTLIFDKKIRIVHIHTAHKGSFYRKSIICHLAKLLRKKVVLHIHSGNFKSFYAKSRIKPYIRYTLRRCDALICLSPQWEE